MDTKHNVFQISQHSLFHKTQADFIQAWININDVEYLKLNLRGRERQRLENVGNIKREKKREREK